MREEQLLFHYFSNGSSLEMPAFLGDFLGRKKMAFIDSRRAAEAECSLKVASSHA
jgi:hypothetical protein